MRNTYSRLASAILIDQTAKAMKLEIETSENKKEQIWVPESQISIGDWKEGIWMSDWFIEKKESEMGFMIKTL